jgi:signal transduction histidine kinase
VRPAAPAEAVAELPWLCPGADALRALARADGAACWAAVRHDPATVLLAARRAEAFHTPAAPFPPSCLHDPALLETVLRHLREHPGRGFVDWGGEGRAVHQAALRYARGARHLAEQTGRCDPEHAWAAGLLAPLGWLAVAAADPGAAAACLADPDHARQPIATQRRHWGLDAAALARRAARRWSLPDWVAAVAGRLGLDAETASGFGAEPELFRVVQAAVALVQEGGGGLGLEVGTTPSEAAASLGVKRSEMGPGVEEEAAPGPFHDPAGVPLLPDLLALALENRRLRAAPAVRRLEAEVDGLHDALREARASEAERLRAQKLESLAEFAAGAGHEINNPLAVISGQAQFLLNKLRGPRSRLVENEIGDATDGEPVLPSLAAADAEAPLRKIIEQAQRVHLILRDLMQFARPPRPHRQGFDLGELVREVAASLDDLAGQRRVRLIFVPPGGPVPLHADPSQVRTAVTCLLRNAVEAAPADGWAGVRLEAGEDRVEVVVEDNGAGPPAPQREHLFDPFYSGRSAGRGRGLGLPTAWRLAREQGGDVRFVSLPDGPTRFVLSLSRAPANGAAHNGHLLPDASAKRR